MSLRVADRDGGAVLAVKAVPGSSRDGIAGVLGDALKVAVAAPPERGRANARLCELLAGALGVARGDVQVVAGGAAARKQLFVRGLAAAEVLRRLGL
jgi:uncharacterized protein (TIGR00251 family)